MALPAQFPTVSDRAVVGYIFQGMNDAAQNSWVPLVSNQFTSDQASETYAGIGAPTPMREWLGGKQANSFKEYSLTISNKDWESTMKVLRKDLNRDKTGQLMMQIGRLSERGIEHEAKLLTDLILAGTGSDMGLAYDGQFFFDTDHSVGSSGTMSNSISVDISALPTGDVTGSHGSTTSPSVGEFALSVQKGIIQILGFKDDQGEPTNQSAKSFGIMVPTSLLDVAEAAISNPVLVQGFNNPLVNSPSGMTKRIIHNPRLTWTDKFAVFRLDGPVKSFISQIEEGPNVEVLGEGSDYAFFNKAHLYSVIKSGNVGYGDFTKACLVTMA